jgi:dTDP-glucose pyrophosphorylase
MAGLGSRFSKAGFLKPKPLIEIHGVPMIKVVINNLTPSCSHRFIFICQEDHIAKFNLDILLKLWAPNCLVVSISGVTEGAACTVLKAKDFINNDQPLMVANCDQFIDVNINEYLMMLDSENYDGLIMTMKANDPKWSFVSFDNFGRIQRVVEKEVISDEATVGIYNFKHGKDFVFATEKMISQGDRINGEYYVAPIYNYLIKGGRQIGFFNIGNERSGMYGLGIPEDLEYFVNSPISQKVI